MSDPTPQAVRTDGTCLSRGTREILCALANTAMPAGKRFPAAGWPAVDRFDRFMASQPLAWRLALEASARLFEETPRVRTGRSFTSLDGAERLAHLESLHRGTYPGRMLLRSLLGLLKVAHYDDPELFAAVGCAYQPEPVVGESAEPRYLERAVDGRTLPDGEQIEAEVVVVGSGAGGAAVAAELAEGGAAVVLLEEGGYFHRRDFNGRPPQMIRKLYREFGVTGTVGNCVIAIPLGRCVGGTTTVNSGTCYRAPGRVFDKWRELGLGDLSAEALDPFYTKVEQILRTAPADRALCGGIGRMVARGCEALGFRRHGPLTRNAPDCDAQGFCVFGCPTDAKRSANISFVPLALRYGARLVYNARVTRVLFEGGRAVGVEASTAAGTKLTVRARAVVLAAGTLLTPVMLLAQKLARRSGQVGRNLSVHPALGVLGQFPEPIGPCHSIPQGYGVEEFHEEGILFEGAQVPLDAHAGSVVLVGPRFTELLEAYERSGYFGFLIEDTSRGRVVVGAGGKPLVTYVMNDHDVAKLKRGVEILSRIFLAAGAEAVYPMAAGFEEIRDLRDLERFRATRFCARDFELTAHHPLGTARMGPDPRSSVVGPTHETHDHPGLFICDGSVMPTSLGVNPQLTIMALALRAAGHVARAVG